MTVFVTGGTGKTSFSLFFTHRNQIEKREKIFSVFNRECNFPGFSGSSGKAAFCPEDMEKDIVAAILRYLKQRPLCFAWKTHGVRHSGYPGHYRLCARQVLCFRGEAARRAALPFAGSNFEKD